MAYEGRNKGLYRVHMFMLRGPDQGPRDIGTYFSMLGSSGLSDYKAELAVAWKLVDLSIATTPEGEVYVHTVLRTLHSVSIFGEPIEVVNHVSV